MAKMKEVIFEYSVRNKSGEDIPVYSVTNEKGFCTDYFSKEVASKDRTTYKIVPRGYFAYNPSRINVGSIDWQNYEDKVIVSPLYVVFGVSKYIDQQYLLHYFKSDKMLTLIKEYATGSVRDNLKLSSLEEFPIKLRPIDEQRKIAAILDKIGDLISKRRQQLDKLDEMIKARFMEIFGDPETNTKNWRVLPMSKICSVGSSKRIYQSEQSSSGVPFWRISDLTSLITTGTVTPELYIPEERYKELKTQGQVPAPGDILITSRGTLGQCYIVKVNDRFYFQDGMISWLSGYMDGVTPLYISYLFTMPGFRKQIDSMQAGSTVAYLSITMIKKLKVMLPDIESQQQFASFVSKTEKTKTTISRSLEKLETLKKALMQEYFG